MHFICIPNYFEVEKSDSSSSKKKDSNKPQKVNQDDPEN